MLRTKKASAGNASKLALLPTRRCNATRRAMRCNKNCSTQIAEHHCSMCPARVSRGIQQAAIKAPVIKPRHKQPVTPTPAHESHVKIKAVTIDDITCVPLTSVHYKEVRLFPNIHIAHARKQESRDCVLRGATSRQVLIIQHFEKHAVLCKGREPHDIRQRYICCYPMAT